MLDHLSKDLVDLVVFGHVQHVQHDHGRQISILRCLLFQQDLQKVANESRKILHAHFWDVSICVWEGAFQFVVEKSVDICNLRLLIAWSQAHELQFFEIFQRISLHFQGKAYGVIYGFQLDEQKSESLGEEVVLREKSELIIDGQNIIGEEVHSSEALEL